MSSRNSGTIVRYTNKDNKVCYGLFQSKEQKPEFNVKKKILITLLNDDYTPKLDANQKPMVTLKDMDKCTPIGYSD